MVDYFPLLLPGPRRWPALGGEGGGSDRRITATGAVDTGLSRVREEPYEMRLAEVPLWGCHSRGGGCQDVLRGEGVWTKRPRGPG